MRLFTAIDIPDSLREKLAALPVEENLSCRQTSPEQWHVTLRFIGEVDENQAERYRDALAKSNAAPAQCRPYGLDVLPSRRAPRVVMLGLERTDSLLTLYETVSDLLKREGLDPEDRTYRPHVTIARLDDAEPETVQTFVRSHEEHSFPPFEADQFVLYESTLTAEGAIHEPYATYDLTP